ncbi:hypothetical protein HED54_03725 [Ochrobactrum anthropi ATCC 49188]|nr:hypothetical protein [Brucella anthropi ATCC 49188]
MSSEQYRQLREKTFTSPQLLGDQYSKSPHDLVQFEAAFEQQEQGTGFKYIVRYARLNTLGRYPKTFKVVPDTRRHELFRLIEHSARVSQQNRKRRYRQGENIVTRRRWYDVEWSISASSLAQN